MRASLLVLILLGLPVAVVQAATEFPYEAVVQNSGVIVRSGPGERYDPTLQLQSGARVTVHRHDPGGWYMIAPPAGSFSWIDAAHVQKQGPNKGAVSVAPQGDGLPPRVVVWIGSEFTSDRKYFGRQLAHGDTVDILEEQTLPTDRGPVLYYKIAPPRLEYRWVKGDFVVPLSEAGTLAPSSQPNPLADALTVPAPAAAPPQEKPLSELWANSDHTGQSTGSSQATLKERELTRTIDNALPQFPDASSSEDDIALHNLDEQLRNMLAQGPAAWDLEGMQQAYLQLQTTSRTAVSRQISHRLRIIDERRQVKTQFDEFTRLTTETNMRDAQLLSMQNPALAQSLNAMSNVDLGPPGAFPQQGPTPEQGSRSVLPPQQPMTATPGPVAPGGATPSLTGAGVVQRVEGAPPGTPPYALVTPDGRLLAYLHPGPGVQIDQYLGHGMGLIGQRSHDPQLGTDVIVVQKLVPVQLQLPAN